MINSILKCYSKETSCARTQIICMENGPNHQNIGVLKAIGYDELIKYWWCLMGKILVHHEKKKNPLESIAHTNWCWFAAKFAADLLLKSEAY